MTNYWVEIRKQVRRTGPPKLVPPEEVNNHTGFRSVYTYSDETAELIRIQGGTRGLRGTPVYADTLFMDFDNQPAAAAEFKQKLIEADLIFTEWDSGNRSVHFHIATEPYFAPWLPAAQKAWVLRNVPAEVVDISFYHPGGQYRLANTYHSKTGRRKILTDSGGTKKLVLHAPKQEIRSRVEVASESTLQLYRTMLTATQGEGGRSPHLWRLATVGLEAGLEYDRVMDDLLWWNKWFAKPMHDPQVVEKQVNAAFTRLQQMGEVT